MHEQQEPNYMTIGELADKVGVTVRTIQYYDQENLLKPSAKGSRNQRLYTEKDEDYRVYSRHKKGDAIWEKLLRKKFLMPI